MRATVVILTKLPGLMPVKTRLWPLLGEEGARRFYLDALRRAVELACAFDPAPGLWYSPEDAADPEASLPGFANLRPVAGMDGATCLENALTAAFDGQPLLALGGDAPDLPVARVREVLAALADHDAVFVPTGDGGFSCLGLRKPVNGLAGGFTYGDADALANLMEFLGARGLSVVQTEPWPDVDTPADYEAYRRRSATG